MSCRAWLLVRMLLADDSGEAKHPFLPSTSVQNLAEIVPYESDEDTRSSDQSSVPMQVKSMLDAPPDGNRSGWLSAPA